MLSSLLLSLYFHYIYQAQTKEMLATLLQINMCLLVIWGSLKFFYQRLGHFCIDTNWIVSLIKTIIHLKTGKLLSNYSTTTGVRKNFLGSMDQTETGLWVTNVGLKSNGRGCPPPLWKIFDIWKVNKSLMVQYWEQFCPNGELAKLFCKCWFCQYLHMPRLCFSDTSSATFVTVYATLSSK